MELVKRLGHVAVTTQEFSSSTFVAEAYERRQLEAEHFWMQPVTYTDFEAKEASNIVIFGTDKAMLTLRILLDLVLEGRITSLGICVRSLKSSSTSLSSTRPFISDENFFAVSV
jgi:hypothetical protein